jgi:drug/metabolite transporter (DMT)-like permease
LLAAALILTPLTLLRHWEELQRISRRDWLLMTVSGIFLGMHFALWVTSLEYTSVLISVTLVTTTPIWVAFLEWGVLRQPLGRNLLIGLAIALVGGVLIGLEGGSETQPPSGNHLWLGSALAIGGAIAVSVYFAIGRSVRSRLSLLPYIWVVYGIAGLAVTAVLLLQQVPLLGYPPTAYLWLLALTIFPQLIGHSAMNYAVKYVSATYVSIATKIEPIGSAVIAYFAFAELPGVWQVVGSVVLLVAVVVASIDDKPATQQKTKSVASATESP